MELLRAKASEADLDTNEHASHWILQGVALVQNIDQ